MEIRVGNFLVIDSEKRQLNFHGLILDYPVGYSCFAREEEPHLLIIARFPHTIGSLMPIPSGLETEEKAIWVFEEWVKAYPTAAGMDINGYKAWLVTEEVKMDDREKLLWPHHTGPLAVYQYMLRVKNNIVLFSYRIPPEYEDDGKFDEEHEAKMSIIASATKYLELSTPPR